MDYSWWLCNAEGEVGGACKSCFSLSVKVLKDNRHIKLTGLDFNTLSQTADEKTKTHKKSTPADMGAV